LPSIRQHPVASFQAAFFAKRASLRVCPAKPFGFCGHAKKFQFPLAPVDFIEFLKISCCE